MHIGGSPGSLNMCALTPANLSIFVKFSPFRLTLSKADGYFPDDSTPPSDDKSDFSQRPRFT